MMDHPDRQERDQFDIDYGVNTATPLGRMNYKRIQNLTQGHAYQASWTQEIRTNFDYVYRHLNERFKTFTFIDIGWGKGKVNLVWQQELDRVGIEQTNIGIEYYEPLNVIARNNWTRLFPNRPHRFIQADAATQDVRRYGEKLILYMYNPFEAMIMLQFLRNLKNWPTVLVYNVPTCDRLVRTNGFKVIHERSGPNQNLNNIIYTNF